MSFALTLGARAETLAVALARDLARPGSDPYRTRRVCVPSPGLKHWLQHKLADHGGLFGIVFDYFETALRHALTEAVPDAAPPEGRFLDAAALRPRVLALLAGAWPERAGPDAAAFRDYLASGGPAGSTGRWRRAASLADRLAGLFLEYENHMPGLIRLWRDRASAADPGASALWKAERALYRALFVEPAAMPDVHPTLAQWADRRGAALENAPPDPSAPPLAIFGLTHISSRHARLLMQLARARNVDFYWLAAAPEFWRDAPAGAADARARWRAAVAAGRGASPPPDAPDPWRWWGDAVRRFPPLLEDEHQRVFGAGIAPVLLPEPLLNDPADADAEPLLRRAQRAILGGPARPGAQDASMQIVAAPGARREVEAVALSIRQNLRDDPALRPHEIGVLAVDMPTYLPHLRAVLGDGRSPAPGAEADADAWLPYHLADADARAASAYAGAVESLLELPEGSWTRAEVLGLLDNPCVRAAAAVSQAELDEWRGWIGRANIFHALDGDDKRRRLAWARAETAAPDAPENDAFDDAFTWREGLARLRLGRVLSRGGGTFPEPLAGVEAADADAAGRLSRWFETLAGWADRGVEPRPPSAWASWLEEGLDALLSPPDAPGERALAERIRASARGFADRDALFSAAGAANVPRFALRDAVLGDVADLSARYGNPLAGGAFVASLRPMRPVPFRLVYVLGLGEGLFPGNDDAGPLDLRDHPGEPGVLPAAERPGDPSPAARNRCLFLETCLAARDKLILSYVARDLARDREYHPAEPLLQWEDWLERRLLRVPDGQRARWFRVVAPLAPWSEAYLNWQPGYAASGRIGGRVRPEAVPAPPPDGYAYAFDPKRVARLTEAMADDDPRQRTLALGLLLRRAGLDGGPPGPANDLPPALRRRLAAGADAVRGLVACGQSADAGLAAVAPLVVPAAPSPPLIRAALPVLRRFLRDPADAYRQRHLRLPSVFDDADAPVDPAAGEPFRTEGAIFRKLTVEPLEMALAAAADPGAAEALALDGLRALHARSRSLRDAPEGIFGDIDRERLERALRGRMEALGPFLNARRVEAERTGAAPGAWRRVAFGSTREDEPAAWRLPPLRLAAPAGLSPGAPLVEIELSGRLPLIWEGGDRNWVLIVASGRDPEPVHALEAYLFALCARTAAAEARAGRSPEWADRSAADRDRLDRLGGRPWTLAVCGAEKCGEIATLFAASDADGRGDQEARRTLEAILSGWLDPDRYDDLPFAAAADLRKHFPADSPADSEDAAAEARYAAALRAWLRRMAEHEDGGRGGGGPPWGRLAPPAAPADARTQARARFKLLWDGMAAKG